MLPAFLEIDPFLKWLAATALAVRIRDSLLLFPMLESAHVVGLTLVFGTIAVIDLRLLGFASTSRPFQRMASDILKWTWAAFGLTALTGLLMFLTNAPVYYHNFFFRTKMLLLVLTGVNMLIFELTTAKTVHGWNRAPAAPPAGRAVAAASLVLWIAIIFMGRLIGFTTTRATPVAPPPAGVNFEDFVNSAPGDSGASTPQPGK